ncbi:formate dehydrogenase accessory sulfurtransferase FdhD [Marinobacter nauticus]|nr:formate dehydrogenase accessory sulfurtransferase FdhD [Marinobacter nauticus]
MWTQTPATVEALVDIRGGIRGSSNRDRVAEEVPVAMVYNGISHAVMMASPRDLEDLAVGFSLSEAIVDHADQIFQMDIEFSEHGISLEMRIHGECLANLKNQRRNMVGRTGCGLCGTESLSQTLRAFPPVPERPLPNDTAIQFALRNLREHQPMQTETGATHAAAWCDLNGLVKDVREDVGRHNALDKLIGARIGRHGASAFQSGFVLVSSRASYEMVQKAAINGIGCLVAVSAPTSLAIRTAQEAGLVLVGFARPGRHVIYTVRP